MAIKAPAHSKNVSARTLLEKFNTQFGNKYKLTEEEEKDLKDADKEMKEEDELEKDTEEDMNATGEQPVGVAQVIEDLIAQQFSKDGDSMKEACDGMDKLVEAIEAGDPQAKAFMEALDCATSAMELKEDGEDSSYGFNKDKLVEKKFKKKK